MHEQLDGEAEYIGTFTNEGQDVKLQEWLLQLPRTLWELGGNHLTTSEVSSTISCVLALCAQTCSRPSFDSYFASVSVDPHCSSLR